MTDRQGKIRLLLSLGVLLLCIAGSYCIYRYIKHETANFASPVCVFRLNRCEHIASPVYGYGSSV